LSRARADFAGSAVANARCYSSAVPTFSLRFAARARLRGGSALARAALALALAGCAPASGGVIAAGRPNVVVYDVAARKVAPAVAGPSLRDGPPIAAARIAGKVALVNFWASDCGPCRKEMPMLQSLAQRYGARGVEFLGVDTRQDRKVSALAFVDSLKVSYPSVYDPAYAIAARFEFKYLPATFVIDKQGRIAAQIVGAIASESDVTSILDSELAR
jgi:thiol-disulfide isomerase/thioredoxin